MDEKCAQVRLMRDIYREASHVVAWLGEPTKETKEAFLFINHVQSGLNNIFECIKNPGISDLLTLESSDKPSWVRVTRVLIAGGRQNIPAGSVCGTYFQDHTSVVYGFCKSFGLQRMLFYRAERTKYSGIRW